jgi:hypothetical protein
MPELSGKKIGDGDDQEGRARDNTLFRMPSNHLPVEVRAMAYFEDLSPYAYLHPEEERPGTVNIGWL